MLVDGVIITIGHTIVGNAVFITAYLSEFPAFRQSPGEELLVFVVFAMVCLFLWRMAIGVELDKRRFRREFLPLRFAYMFLGGFAQIILHIVLDVGVASMAGVILVALIMLAMYQGLVALTSRFPRTSSITFMGLLAVALGTLSVAPAAALIISWLA